ncbi:class I SAM-dependent methyltransferase [Halovenus salina]|uniref:Class I SAM-dependent methyltransferase n=1 Tax=Halovenus salina TaxID=1510225 RepID=A0ABD5W5D3_9EURY|nr:class I SAM-dependent methyltransferase [Halovenus salina]
MRQFTAEYLESTRAGMWEDSLDALGYLDIESRERILDVGAGTGELTRVLRDQTAGTVVALDADRGLLGHVASPRLLGDATQLPFAEGSFDLVVCQALLVNLPDPAAVIEEFARVSTDRVAVIEPDNSAVAIESTVDTEAALARRARESYLAGVETDAALGAVPDLFRSAGLDDITVDRYDHERSIESPYSERALEGARRKASGTGIDDDRETILAGDTSVESFEDLREQWRAMGREVIEQMQDGRYRQREVVPFYVTSGRV